MAPSLSWIAVAIFGPLAERWAGFCLIGANHENEEKGQGQEGLLS
jgi:hypothetical protein